MLAELLQGTGTGQTGTVNVGSGSVSLSGGTLQANFSNGLTPAAGQTFNNVMTFAPSSLNGLFGALQNGNGALSTNPTYLNLGSGLTLGVNYNNSAGNVQLQVVNTPATTAENWNGGTGNWSTGSGWSSGSSPTFYSDVGIGLTASGNVTLNQDGTINSLAIHNGKHFKKGEMRYLLDREVYQLTLFDRADKALVFEGNFKGKRLKLTRKDKATGATQEIQMYQAGDGLRFLYEYAVKPANRVNIDRRAAAAELDRAVEHGFHSLPDRAVAE